MLRYLHALMMKFIDLSPCNDNNSSFDFRLKDIKYLPVHLIREFSRHTDNEQFYQDVYIFYP